MAKNVGPGSGTSKITSSGTRKPNPHPPPRLAREAASPPSPDPAFVKGPTLRAIRDEPIAIRKREATLSFAMGGPVRNKAQVLNQLTVLIGAFEEVDEYDPMLHHNRPPPALWIDDADYRRDVKSLLHELRQLNDLLRNLAPTEAAKAAKAAGVATKAATKFIDSYAEALGKGAAYLTIGATATLLLNVGVPKEAVDAVWGLVKGGK